MKWCRGGGHRVGRFEARERLAGEGRFVGVLRASLFGWEVTDLRRRLGRGGFAGGWWRW